MPQMTNQQHCPTFQSEPAGHSLQNIKSSPIACRRAPVAGVIAAILLTAGFLGFGSAARAQAPQTLSFGACHLRRKCFRGWSCLHPR